MKFIFLYATASSEKESKRIARHLLEKKLIACANIFPINSMYQWKGKITEQNEAVLIMKTAKEKVKAIRKEIEKIHSYTIPCIMELAVSPNGVYGKWLQEQLTHKGAERTDL